LSKAEVRVTGQTKVEFVETVLERQKRKHRSGLYWHWGMWSRAVNKGGHLGKSYWVTFVNDAGYLVRVSSVLHLN